MEYQIWMLYGHVITQSFLYHGLDRTACTSLACSHTYAALEETCRKPLGNLHGAMQIQVGGNLKEILGKTQGSPIDFPMGKVGMGNPHISLSFPTLAQDLIGFP